MLSACDYFSNENPEILPLELELSPDDPQNLPSVPDPRLPGFTTQTDWEDDGILRFSMRPPQTLNPLLNRDKTVNQILGLIFEPVAVLDDNLRPVGHLANLDFALDFSSVVVSINNEAIWSDGLPVSSDDFIFSYETLKNAPDDVIYKNKINNIASVTRVDDRTVLVGFANATPTVGYALLFPLIPRHYYRNETNPASLRNMSPLGNGPFLFEGMIPQQSMNLVRNPNTFRQLPYIERVEVLFLPDGSIDIYAFDRGLVDVLHLPLPEWVQNPSAKAMYASEFPAMYFEFIGFNFTREIFYDLDIRQGIAYSFDVNETISTLYLHHAVRAATPVHPNSWKHDPAILSLPYDPDLARLLLRDIPREKPLVIIAGKNNRERLTVAYRLASGLEDAGLNVRVDALNDDEFLQRLTDDDYDLFVGWMELSQVPDFAFLFGGERTSGVLFLHDPVLEGLFNATLSASTESAYIGAMSLFQQTFAEQLPVLSLAFRHSAVLKSERVQTNTTPSPGNIFVYVNTWKIVAK
jgi:peptide/nickel transport system substrate-binding protein